MSRRRRWTDGAAIRAIIAITCLRRRPRRGFDMADVYGAVFRNVLFPGWESMLRGRPTLKRLAYLEKTQWRPRAEIAAQQFADLKRLIEHAARNVPFYREHWRAHWEAAGAHPEALRSLDDLLQFPVVTRDRARESQESRVSTAEPRPTIRKTTGGTT